MEIGRFVVIYLWRGERYRGTTGYGADAVREARELRADGWQAWIERVW